jgi:hypothetical protein
LPAEWLVVEASKGVYEVHERMVYGPFRGLASLEAFLDQRQALALGYA